MTKPLLTGAAALCLFIAGTAHADDGTPGGNTFSYRTTFGAQNAAPSHAAPAAGPASQHYNTHCGTGGWDADGGGIPQGCSTGPAISSSTSPLDGAVPDARPGECFARVVVPALYDQVPETVTTQDGYERLSINPPAFEPGTESVQVRDPGTKYIVHEPRYEVRTEQVLVRPAHERLEVVPATFNTVTEHVTVGEPRHVWKPGKNLSNIQRKDPNTGAVYCLVEEPAETVAVQRRVLQTPEQVRTVTVPAEYTTVTRRVLVDPGRVEEQPILAEFQDVAVKRLVQPASQSAVPIAPETRTVTRRVLRSPERFEWVPVLCDTNATTSSISDIQSALAMRGYYNGPVDGIMGPATEQALTRFQSSQGLEHQGYLSADTLAALGLHTLAASIAPARPVATRAPAPVSIEPVRSMSQPAPAAMSAPRANVRPSPSELRYSGTGIPNVAAPSTAQTAPSAERFKVRAVEADERVLTWSGKR